MTLHIDKSLLASRQHSVAIASALIIAGDLDLCHSLFSYSTIKRARRMISTTKPTGISLQMPYRVITLEGYTAAEKIALGVTISGAARYESYAPDQESISTMYGISPEVQSSALKKAKNDGILTSKAQFRQKEGKWLRMQNNVQVMWSQLFSDIFAKYASQTRFFAVNGWKKVMTGISWLDQKLTQAFSSVLNSMIPKRVGSVQKEVEITPERYRSLIAAGHPAHSFRTYGKCIYMMCEQVIYEEQKSASEIALERKVEFMQSYLHQMDKVDYDLLKSTKTVMHEGEMRELIPHTGDDEPEIDDYIRQLEAEGDYRFSEFEEIEELPF